MQHEWPHYLAAKIASRALSEAGFEAYIIGGAVRDILLGHNPKDFDLATNATPAEILKLPNFVKSNYKDTAQAYGVTRVYVKFKSDFTTHEIELEIATYRQDIEAHLGRKQTKVAFANLEDDLKRRDFTINALALDPATNQLIDEVGGVDDLEHQLVRFIGDPRVRIAEDPVRILRAIRIKNQLGFNYEAATKQALISAIKTGKVDDIASERIGFELTRIISHGHRQFGLKDLDDFGALERLIPELTAAKGVDQPKNLHAEGDVFRHSLLSMAYLPEIISPRLAWATLLHDVGKPQTATPPRSKSDRIRFDNHYKIGAEIAVKILRRLHFGKRLRDDVAWMINYHLGIDDLPHMRPKRAEAFMHHPAFADLLELHRADARAAWIIDNDGLIDKNPPNFAVLENLWANFQAEAHKSPPSISKDLGIDGAWLIKNFSLSAGPKLGKILAKLQSAYLDGKIKTLDQAKTLVKHLLKPDRKK